MHGRNDVLTLPGPRLAAAGLARWCAAPTAAPSRWGATPTAATARMVTACKHNKKVWKD